MAKNVVLSQKTQKTQIPRTLTRGGPAKSQEYLRFGFFEFFGTVQRFWLLFLKIIGFTKGIWDSTTFLYVFALVVVWELWRGLGISGKLSDALGDFGMLWEAFWRLWALRSIDDLLSIFLLRYLLKS
jgi:hypothetical protein